jgi:hypothetical protein
MQCSRRTSSVTTTVNRCMSAMSDAVEVIVTGLDSELGVEITTANIFSFYTPLYSHHPCHAN